MASFSYLILSILAHKSKKAHSDSTYTAGVIRHMCFVSLPKLIIQAWVIQEEYVPKISVDIHFRKKLKMKLEKTPSSARHSVALFMTLQRYSDRDLFALSLLFAVSPHFLFVTVI